MDSMRFECQAGCVKCCEVKGYVYLTEDDLLRAAAFLDMTPADFESQYVLRFRHLLRLRKPLEGQCHFLSQNGCSIHPAKPTQCRLFPFWPELVESRKRWQETASFCPGIGKGPFVQIGSACETAGEMKTAYPSMY